MPRRGGSALDKLAAATEENGSGVQVPRKLGFDLDAAMGDLPQANSESQTEDASGLDLSSIDEKQLTPEMQVLVKEMRKTQGQLENDRETLSKEGRKLRSSHHAAGLMDNETVQKAQLYDALLANPSLLSSDPRFAALSNKGDEPPELDAETQEALDGLPPESVKAIMHLAKQSVLQDPAVKAKLDSYDRVQNDFAQQQRAKNQKELDAAVQRMEELGYDPKEVITADAAQQIIAMRNAAAFNKLSMSQIVERATGITLSKRKRPSNNEIPPFESGNRNSAPKNQPKTRSIQEAGRRVLERMRKER